MCFVSFAAEPHFDRAAASLFITQPTLSLQFKQLEISLGFELAHRARRLALTEEGCRLLPFAEHVLTAVGVFAIAAAKRGRLQAA